MNSQRTFFQLFLVNALTLINTELVQSHVRGQENVPHRGIRDTRAHISHRGSSPQAVPELNDVLFDAGLERSVESFMAGIEGLTKLLQLLVDSTQGLLALPPGVVRLGELFLHLLETVTGLSKI